VYEPAGNILIELCYSDVFSWWLRSAFCGIKLMILVDGLIVWNQSIVVCPAVVWNHPSTPNLVGVALTCSDVC
jgi:hypothetical protein